MWELRPESLALLEERVARLQPGLIVEAGSGKSTAVLARHGKTIALEHLRAIAERTRLEAPTAEVRLCKLRPFHTIAGTFKWYDTDLPNGIDFALIDGPPGLTIGRQAAVFALWPYLSTSGWEIWLDDANRQHERDCLALWKRFFFFDIERLSESLVRLTPPRKVTGSHPPE